MTPLEAIKKLVAALTSETRWHKVYPCTVEGQSGNTLDLRPDDESIRGTGLSAVPIRHGLPGVEVRVPRGARVLLGWEAGDPRRPYAALWEPGSIESISFAGGDKPLARAGDPVTCFWPAAVPVTGTLAGAPFIGTMTITSPSSGIIDGGNEQVTG